jgi:hypothetical protein
MKALPRDATICRVMLATLFLGSCLGLIKAQDSRPVDPWSWLAIKHDKNNDKKITKDEYGRGDDAFARLDVDANGVITQDDIEQLGKARRQGARNQKRPQAPAVGDQAPDFELARLDDLKKKIKLSDLYTKKPVVLIFGSYT